MSIFCIILGASKIEFSVTFENNQYVGRVNGTTLVSSTDYESVRAEILKGMEPSINPNKLH